MADTSNLFSANGFNRQKQFSGLHASKEENRDIYFETIEVTHDPLYLSIISTSVDSIGYEYPNTTTITYPTPQHPDGLSATADPMLTPYSGTFTISNPGSNYSLNETFGIDHLGVEIGFFYVTATGAGGSISTIKVVSDPILNYLDNTITELPTYTYTSTNTSAVFNVNNLFALSNIAMRKLGRGYQTGQNNNPTISPTTSSPATLSISYDPQVILIPSEFNHRYITYNTAYEMQYNEYTPYVLRRNISLPDPNEA